MNINISTEKLHLSNHEYYIHENSKKLNQNINKVRKIKFPYYHNLLVHKIYTHYKKIKNKLIKFNKRENK